MSLIWNDLDFGLLALHRSKHRTLFAGTTAVVVYLETLSTGNRSLAGVPVLDRAVNVSYSHIDIRNTDAVLNALQR